MVSFKNVKSAMGSQDGKKNKCLTKVTKKKIIKESNNIRHTVRIGGSENITAKGEIRDETEKKPKS